MLEAGNFTCDIAQALCPGLVYEGDPGLAVVADQHHLAGMQPWREGHADEASDRKRVLDLPVRAVVVGEQRDALAGLNPGPSQCVGDPVDPAPELAVGRAPFAVEHRQPGCVEAVAALHQRPEADVLDGAWTIHPASSLGLAQLAERIVTTAAAGSGLRKPPAFSASATLAPSTCRSPARPRSWSTSSTS